jgi:hypothetical protein
MQNTKPMRMDFVGLVFLLSLVVPVVGGIVGAFAGSFEGGLCLGLLLVAVVWMGGIICLR